jgi:hypothetical protein
VNFDLLEPYLNITPLPSTDNFYGDTEIEILQGGLLTSFPWNIGTIGADLTVPLSHTTCQFAQGLVWLKYIANTMGTCTDILTNNDVVGTNNFYLTTNNNTAMIQTGHSNGAATVSEQQILANVFMYLGANANVSFIPKKYCSVIFVLDITGSMSDRISGIVTQINAFIAILNSQSLAKMEIGLVMYNSVIGIESISFSTGQWLNESNVIEMANDINAIEFTDISGEVTMAAIQFAINKYTFNTLGKNIIFISDEEGDDNDKVYDTISLCQSNNIHVFGIVNELNTNQYLNLLATSCSGFTFDITGTWSLNLLGVISYLVFTTSPPSYVASQPNLASSPTDIQPIVDTNDSISNINTYNSNTVYHKISDATPNSEDDIMIGKVFLRHNASLNSTVLVDARTRGGGVLEDIADELRHELEPESDFYFDIGYYDGDPYNENSVVLVRLDNKLLQEYGGQLTHEQITEKVNKWVALGTYPIIEYVNTYTTDYCNNTVEIDETVTTNGYCPFVEAIVVNSIAVNVTGNTSQLIPKVRVIETDEYDYITAIHTDITIEAGE